MVLQTSTDWVHKNLLGNLYEDIPRSLRFYIIRSGLSLGIYIYKRTLIISGCIAGWEQLVIGSIVGTCGDQKGNLNLGSISGRILFYVNKP